MFPIFFYLKQFLITRKIGIEYYSCYMGSINDFELCEHSTRYYQPLRRSLWGKFCSVWGGTYKGLYLDPSNIDFVYAAGNFN